MLMERVFGSMDKVLNTRGASADQRVRALRPLVRTVVTAMKALDVMESEGFEEDEG